MTRWAILLKGLNIGGKRLPMPELKAFLESLGGQDVKTLLASGNAVMTFDEHDGETLEPALERAAAEKLTLKTDWLVRSHAELAAIVKANPFPDEAKDHPSKLVVTFHREEFPNDRIAALDHDGPERLVAIGRELYIDFPDGQGVSKLPQAMAKARFPKVATARNWNTLLKLRDATV